jgi:hypothetical protein
MDFETQVIDGSHKPILICTYDGTTSKPFYITQFRSAGEMIRASILSLCRFKYQNYLVYVHNFAKFDGVFLFKELAKLGDVNILMNKGRLISIELEYRDPKWENSVKFIFRDSYLIIPDSLKKLAINFNVETQKTIFPYRYLNYSTLNLNYIGEAPHFNHFYEITMGEYNTYISKITDNNWDLKAELTKYCINDCIALWQVMYIYTVEYFNEFNINLKDHPTVSSHAYRLYRTHYMPKDTIPMIYGKEYDLIRKSYTGGVAFG